MPMAACRPNSRERKVHQPDILCINAYHLRNDHHRQVANEVVLLTNVRLLKPCFVECGAHNIQRLARLRVKRGKRFDRRVPVDLAEVAYHSLNAARARKDRRPQAGPGFPHND